MLTQDIGKDGGEFDYNVPVCSDVQFELRGKHTNTQAARIRDPYFSDVQLGPINSLYPLTLRESIGPNAVWTGQQKAVLPGLYLIQHAGGRDALQINIVLRPPTFEWIGENEAQNLYKKVIVERVCG